MTLMVRDIRELLDQPDAYAAELRRRWGGLLSYRYLGRRYSSMDNGPEDNTVAVRHDMRDPNGGLLLAVVGICSPEGGAMSDLEDVPNPVVHSCQVLDSGRDVQRIEIVSESLKRGRQFGFSRSVIRDAHDPDRVLALTEGQGISLGAPPEGLAKMDTAPIPVTDSPDLPPLSQVFGACVRDDGHWRLPVLTVDVASPDAALHIGPQFVGLEAAARQRASQVVSNEPLSGLASHTMFVARGKVGPFRIEANPVVADRRVAVRAAIFDEGADDRLITAASFLFSRS